MSHSRPCALVLSVFIVRSATADGLPAIGLKFGSLAESLQVSGLGNCGAALTPEVRPAGCRHLPCWLLPSTRLIPPPFSLSVCLFGRCLFASIRLVECVCLYHQGQVPGRPQPDARYSPLPAHARRHQPLRAAGGPAGALT